MRDESDRKQERRVKSIRLSDEELEQVTLLLQHLRRFDSEHSLLVNAARNGILLLAAEDNRPRDQRYGGMSVDDLAAQLNTILLPALSFLAEHNKLPSIFRQTVVIEAAPISSNTMAAPFVPAAEVPLFEDDAAEDIDNLGPGLLDDDD